MSAEIFILVAYDISADRRRRRLVKVLEDCGRRVNFSVFECSLTRPVYDELRARIAKIINPRRDSVLYYELCLNCRRRMVKTGVGADAGAAPPVLMV